MRFKINPPEWTQTGVTESNLKMNRILQNFLQISYFENQKRSIPPKLPTKMKFWKSKPNISAKFPSKMRYWLSTWFQNSNAFYDFVFASTLIFVLSLYRATFGPSSSNLWIAKPENNNWLPYDIISCDFFLLFHPTNFCPLIGHSTTCSHGFQNPDFATQFLSGTLSPTKCFNFFLAGTGAHLNYIDIIGTRKLSKYSKSASGEGR